MRAMSRIVLPTGTTADLVRPASRDATRGLVLWPDIMGLRPLFDEHATRLADEQHWVVCAVEPFPGHEELTLDERQAAAKDLDDDAKLADAAAAADAIAGVLGDAPIGLLGFCMGGMYAMKSLALGRFDRAAAFYGMVRVPEAWRGAGQRDAIDAVKARGDASLLCIFGLGDPYCPESDIDEVEAAGAEVVRYEGAGHGWAHDASRENYRTDDAADAWRRALNFLGAP
jgi:dienelactone hydrolase